MNLLIGAGLGWKRLVGWFLGYSFGGGGGWIVVEYWVLDGLWMGFARVGEDRWAVDRRVLVFGYIRSCEVDSWGFIWCIMPSCLTIERFGVKKDS